MIHKHKLVLGMLRCCRNQLETPNVSLYVSPLTLILKEGDGEQKHQQACDTLAAHGLEELFSG